MDNYKARLCCSLKWLAGMLTKEAASYHEAIPVLLDPYNQKGQLKRQVVATLTDPSVYITVLTIILPQENMNHAHGDFAFLIHCLARHGVYVMEGEGVAVNHSVLAQKKPFREASHLAVMDGLMTLYTKSIISVHHVVKTVKRISTFVASKDLPYETNDSLVLWITKVSQAVIQSERAEREDLLQVTDARQRRRNKMQLLGAGEPCIQSISDLCAGVRDGQCLGALLVYYAPQLFKWTDFHFSKQPLSKQQAEENISKVIEFSDTYISPPGFHIDRDMLLESKELHMLEPSIQALIAHFYQNLEIKRITSTNEATDSQVLSSPYQVTASPEPSMGNATGHLSQRKSTTLSLSTRNQSQRSSSTSELLAAKAQALKRFTGTSTRLVGDLKHNKTIPNLYSHSESALTQSRKLENDLQRSLTNTATSSNTNLSVFKAPVRDSMTTKQAAALANFTPRILKPPLHKSSHTRSSPSIHVVPPNRPPTQSASSHNLITASTENLQLREQMLGDSNQRRVSISRAKKNTQSQGRQYTSSGNSSSESSSDLHSNSTNDLHTTSTSRVADVSANCTESWESKNIVTKSHNQKQSQDLPEPVGQPLSDNSAGSEVEHVIELKSSPVVSTQSTAVHYFVSLSDGENDDDDDTELHVRRSFTIDRHHTNASAKAAGLPIIESQEHLSKSVNIQPESCQSPELTTQATQNNESTHDRSSTGSSCSSGPSVIHLDIVLTKPLSLKRSEADAPPAIQNLIKKVRAKTSEISVRHAMAEKQEQILRQRIGRKVILATKDASQLPHKKNSTQQENPENEENLHPVPTQITPTGHIPINDIGQMEIITKVPDIVHTEEYTQEQRAPPLSMTYTSTAKKVQVVEPIVGSLSKFPFSPIAPVGHLDPEPEYQHSIPLSQPSLTFTQPALADGESYGVKGNPWMQETERKKHASPIRQLTQEELQRRREQQVKARLEERERTRKAAQEKRRKTQATERALHELNHPGNGPVSKLQLGVEVDDAATHVHYQLSSQTQNSAEDDHKMAGATGPPMTGRQSDFLSHNGPGCYVRPQTKSNKKLIKNALCYVCLAGDANLTMKQRALAELESTSAPHVLVLFRNIIGFKFRGLYSYSTDNNQVTKIFGSGPKIIKTHMIASLYKYNSGLKEFKEIPSRTFSVSVDALTIQNEYWTNRKSKPPSGPRR